MSRVSYFGFLVCTVCSFALRASADNGTIVSGSVIAIDPINQVMRVYVTGVGGQTLYGNPQTNYVDYLVSPNTVVVGQNSQFVPQANVLVGSEIQMQFAGAFATTVVLLGNDYNDGLVSYSSPNQNYVSTNVVSHSPVQSFARVFRQVSRPSISPLYVSHSLHRRHTHLTSNPIQHLLHQKHSNHRHLGIATPAHANVAHSSKSRAK